MPRGANTAHRHCRDCSACSGGLIRADARKHCGPMILLGWLPGRGAMYRQFSLGMGPCVEVGDVLGRNRWRSISNHD